MTRFDLRLRHPSGETTVTVGEGVLASEDSEFEAWLRDRRVFVISSPPVLELHSEVLTPFSAVAGDWHVLQVPDGEAAKSFGVAADLWNRMLEIGGKRDSRVLALGGGSVGDVAGFVAGCYMRGLEYVQLPTTLLAQVDASIGGKTAINLSQAKNSVGLFHHPSRVVADTRLLRSLPRPEMRSGLMEVLKMSILSDPGLFATVERDLEVLLEGDSEALAPVVAAAARAKIEIVERDPAESRERMLLNLGHTLGHALEAALDYQGLRHGEAVGYGILFVIGLAEQRGLPEQAAHRIRHLIGRFELPEIPGLDVDTLIRLIGRDKKVSEGGWRWILPMDLGACEIVTDLTEAEVRQELGDFLARLESTA